MITTDINGTALGASYDAAVKADSRDFTCRLMKNGAEVNCSIVSLSVGKGHCATENFSIGNAVSNCLTAQLKDAPTLKGETVEVEIGLNVSGTYVYVLLGTFKIVKASTTNYITTVEGFGKIVTETGNTFIPPSTPTIANIAAVCAAAMNTIIAFGAGIQTNLQITAPLDGLTVYQVLQIIALCCGGNAIEQPNGSVRIEQPKTTADARIDAGMMVELVNAEEVNTDIHGIEVEVSPESVDDEGAVIPAVVYQQGSPIDFIIESEYVTDSILQYNIGALVGYSYRPAEYTISLGDPRIDSNDLLAVEDITGATFNTPCHEIVHHYDGGLWTSIKAVEGTDESNDINSMGPVKRMMQEIARQQEKSVTIAIRAKRIADNTAQYFWFTSTGTDTGAHISEVSEAEFTDPTSPNYHSGGNLLARSNGIAVRDGLVELAQFAAGRAVIGEETQSHAVVRDYAFELDSELTRYFIVGDLREDGAITTTFVGDGVSDELYIGVRIQSVQSVTINGVATSAYTVGPYRITMNSVPADGDEIVVVWNAAAAAPYLRSGVIGNEAPGVGSSGVGCRAAATSSWAHAEGIDTTASGIASHAEGAATEASGREAHAEGFDTEASGHYSHAEGYKTVASGKFAHAEGTFASENGQTYQTIASGLASHAEGAATEASGYEAHAEGYRTEASGNQSHAEGYDTTASGLHAHAEGSGSVASGSNSHAGGFHCEAQGAQATAIGLATTAERNNQFVAGFGNIPDSVSLMIIGNGSVSDGVVTNPHNAQTLDTNGNLWIAGNLSQASDRRLKKHIEYLYNNLDTVDLIRELKPARYEKDGREQLGFYAQDVDYVDPYGTLTGESTDGYMTLDYTQLIAPLVAYCQHLEARIEELEKNYVDA